MSGRQASHHSAGSPRVESFLLLDENAFAYTATQQLQRHKPGPNSRLVYLYGPSGVGKSLLARTYLREVRATQSRRRIEHFTASEFAANLAEASSEKELPQFQQHHRDADLVVCEDLASLENRYESQQQLVLLLDDVLARGGECLFTSRVAPGEMPHFLAKLINRLHGGVCAAIEMPGQTSRARLLSHFAQSSQTPLTPPAAARLAEELPVSPRELQAAVHQLDVLCRARGGIVDMDLVNQYLEDETRPQAQTLPKIAGAVARHFGVSVTEMRASSRARDHVVPRQCAMLLAREMTHESLGAIADYFGRRNHSTVIHACHKLEKQMAVQPAMRQHLTRIRGSLVSGAPPQSRKLVEKRSAGSAKNRREIEPG